MIYLTLYNLILLVNDSLQVINNFNVSHVFIPKIIFASFLLFLLSHKLYYNNITI